MAPIVEAALFASGLVFPIAGFYFARRRPGHTRAHLVAGAALGGGLSGALAAAIAASSGGPFLAVLPLALIGLVRGAMIGLAGVVAILLGRWLSHRP